MTGPTGDLGGAEDLAELWRAATEEIADEIMSPQQRAYLRQTRLRAIVEDTALLSVPTRSPGTRSRCGCGRR